MLCYVGKVFELGGYTCGWPSISGFDGVRGKEDQRDDGVESLEMPAVWVGRL